MSFLLRIIIHILANCAAILAADYLIPGFIFSGNEQDLIIAGAILGIVNSLIKPIIKLIAFPMILLTLGLFTIFINIALLLLAAKLIPSLSIHNFWSALGGIIVISLANYILLSIFNIKKKN